MPLTAISNVKTLPGGWVGANVFTHNSECGLTPCARRRPSPRPPHASLGLSIPALAAPSRPLNFSLAQRVEPPSWSHSLPVLSAARALTVGTPMQLSFYYIRYTLLCSGLSGYKKPSNTCSTNMSQQHAHSPQALRCRCSSTFVTLSHAVDWTSNHKHIYSLIVSGNKQTLCTACRLQLAHTWSSRSSSSSSSVS